MLYFYLLSSIKSNQNHSSAHSGICCLAVETVEMSFFLFNVTSLVGGQGQGTGYWVSGMPGMLS